MGLFGALRGAVGAGQPQVQATLDGAEVARGALLRGTATVTGGERAVPLTAFDLELRAVTPNVGSHTLERGRIAMGGVSLAPGQTQEARFEIKVPVGASPSGLTRYELGVSCDVPGLDPKTSVPFVVLEAIDPMAREDSTTYHVLPEPREFRHSSVRGDFRLALLRDGFLGIWKTRVTRRGADGSLRWALDGWGRTASASPDGSRVAVSNGHKQLAFVDGATGAMLGEPITHPTWIDDVVWLSDGSGMVLAGSDQLLVTDLEGRVLRAITDLGWGTPYVSSVCAGPDRSIYVVDANAGKVVCADVDRGILAQAQLQNPNTLHPTRDGALLAIDTSSEIHVLDAHLRPRGRYAIPGKRGVRYVGQAEHSYTHFKTHARVAPDHGATLVNDGTGLLWILDTLTGRPLKELGRDPLDYVEDTMWWDAQHFVAITNDGKVRGMRIDGAVMFEDQDL